jgi:hypothetical protein
MGSVICIPAVMLGSGGRISIISFCITPSLDTFRFHFSPALWVGFRISGFAC